jgi:hypothetical protein
MKNGILIEYANQASPSSSLEWRNISEPERISKVESVIKNFSGSEIIEVKKAHIDGQVIVALNDVMTASERGVLLLNIEDWIKNKLDNGITIWHESIGDKNSLRNLRGIEVNSTEEGL